MPSRSPSPSPSRSPRPEEGSEQDETEEPDLRIDAHNQALADLPEQVVDFEMVPGATHEAYVARRRGAAGIVAAVLAVAGVAAIVVLAVTGSISDLSNVAIGIGVLAALAALFAYRRIGRSSTVALSEEGLLSLTFGDAHHTFDLASAATEVEMVGSPGASGWAVRLVRRGLAPIEVDTSSVDPVLFHEALRQWRPDL